MGIPGSVVDTTLAQYDLTMNTNLRSIFHLTHLAVPHLIASKGSIINVSGANGLRGVSSLIPSSALSYLTKCALRHMTVSCLIHDVSCVTSQVSYLVCCVLCMVPI